MSLKNFKLSGTPVPSVDKSIIISTCLPGKELVQKMLAA